MVGPRNSGDGSWQGEDGRAYPSGGSRDRPRIAIQSTLSFDDGNSPGRSVSGELPAAAG